jgi:hypothetical protein
MISHSWRVISITWQWFINTQRIMTAKFFFLKTQVGSPDTNHAKQVSSRYFNGRSGGWVLHCSFCFRELTFIKTLWWTIYKASQFKYLTIWNSTIKATKESDLVGKKMEGRTYMLVKNERMLCYCTTEQMDKRHSKINCDFSCRFKECSRQGLFIWAKWIISYSTTAYLNTQVLCGGTFKAYN